MVMLVAMVDIALLELDLVMILVKVLGIVMAKLMDIVPAIVKKVKDITEVVIFWN